MAHADIPEMLGRVLSGTKYGVKQTRGKFGLGAKMALIWAKKSTGMPIDVKTSHGPLRAVAASRWRTLRRRPQTSQTMSPATMASGQRTGAFHCACRATRVAASTR